MAVTKDFLQSEILSLESEVRKAQTFLAQAQAVLDAYRMLVNKFYTLQENDDGDHVSAA